MTDFWATFWGGVALLSVSGIAYAAWTDPKLYQRVFWLPAGLVFLAAIGLGSMSTVYGWGWEDAIDAVRTAHPEFAIGLPVRTGERQSLIVFAMFGGVVYMLVMGFVAHLRSEGRQARNSDD